MEHQFRVALRRRCASPKTMNGPTFAPDRSHKPFSAAHAGCFTMALASATSMMASAKARGASCDRLCTRFASEREIANCANKRVAMIDSIRNNAIRYIGRKAGTRAGRTPENGPITMKPTIN